MFKLRLILLMFLLSYLPFISIHLAISELEPLIWHEYEYFDENLPPHFCFNLSRTPYAVSVHINSISPSGYKVEVTITVNGVMKWAGQLGAGESSPTITCDDQYTTIHIANPNGNPSINVKGYIHWVMH